jgi:hypothetical protein
MQYRLGKLVNSVKRIKLLRTAYELIRSGRHIEGALIDAVLCAERSDSAELRVSYSDS